LIKKCNKNASEKSHITFAHRMKQMVITGGIILDVKIVLSNAACGADFKS
jgi:hypothetical protein